MGRLWRRVRRRRVSRPASAEARNVWVTVRTAANTVNIKVRDDGHGAPKLVEGNGLTGIRERVEHLGGSVVFVSSAGRGFELHVTAPTGSFPS